MTNAEAIKYINGRMLELVYTTDLELTDTQKERIDREAGFLKYVAGLCERATPKKPDLVYGEKTNTHTYGRLVSLHCPYCGKFIGALYETDVEMGGGVARTAKGCPGCLQAIDFSEWYCKAPEDEEVIFDE